MTEPAPPQPWPPREGWKFFLLWMAASGAGALLWQWLIVVVRDAGPRGFTLRLWAMETALLVMVNTWHAWLLFRLNWRVFGWVAVPVASYLLGSVFGLFVSTGNLREGSEVHAWIAPIVRSLPWVVILCEMALLVGVRRRLWVWMLAAAAGTYVQIFGSQLLFVQPMRGVIDQLAAAIPLMSRSGILRWVYSGTYLLGELIIALAIAFWIPSIVRERAKDDGAPN